MRQAFLHGLSQRLGPAAGTAADFLLPAATDPLAMLPAGAMIKTIPAKFGGNALPEFQKALPPAADSALGMALTMKEQLRVARKMLADMDAKENMIKDLIRKYQKKRMEIFGLGE